MFPHGSNRPSLRADLDPNPAAALEEGLAPDFGGKEMKVDSLKKNNNQSTYHRIILGKDKSFTVLHGLSSSLPI